MPDAALGFPAALLRHNCPCEVCRDPVTGQRLIEITDIPNGCGVTVEARTEDTVSVVFTPEGHEGVFRRDWLTAHALPSGPAASPGSPRRPARSPWLGVLAGVPESAASVAGDALETAPDPDPRTEDGKRLWRAADFEEPQHGLLGAGWDEYLAQDAVRERCLDAVARFGFALLRDVPVMEGTVLRVAETFGFVRETNYGKLFDVRVVASPANLAFTSRAIPPHTDNPYRDPVPTLQLLHCLQDAGRGGDTGLVDGFAAAAALRAEHPAAFAALTTTPWPFRYADDQAELRARQPLITLSPDGRITAVRLNNRSMGPLRVPAAQAAAAYGAYRTWACLLARQQFLLTLRLTPGDCLIFDNTRVLHARSAFGTAGERHLQGCYADMDGLLSALAVLRRAR